MRSIFLLLFCVVFLSCDKKEKQQIPLENIKVEETVAQVKVEDKLIFTVQISALKNASNTLANLESVNIFKEDNLLKYRFGNFLTYKEAREKRTQLLKYHNGAFVQALLNDTPISISEALQY
jgi:hypothetical protein|tara:strand:- start:1979 stop:2344 length:366 start_codon:yes stop_codon:yes gene_type:complete